MILCAALRVEVNGEKIIVPCWRHGTGMKMLHDIGFPKQRFEEGFITTSNEFLSRTEALDHAIACGQLNVTTTWYKTDHKQDELYSEDLY